MLTGSAITRAIVIIILAAILAGLWQLLMPSPDQAGGHELSISILYDIISKYFTYIVFAVTSVPVLAVVVVFVIKFRKSEFFSASEDAGIRPSQLRLSRIREHYRGKGLIAEFLRSEAKGTFIAAALFAVASAIMFYLQVGEWRMPAILSVVSIARHALTIFRVFTRRFGTTPSEISELLAFLRDRDRNNIPPPNQTGLSEPIFSRENLVEGRNASGALGRSS